MKKLFTLLLLLCISFISQAQLVIVVQAVASSVKAPNALDNVIFYHEGDSSILPIRKVKKKDQIQNVDSIKVQTVYALEKVQKVYGSSISISDLSEDALFYAHTKKYRNARMSSLFAASAWTLCLVNPYFLIVAPLPTIQAFKRDKSVDKAYVMNGKEWHQFKKEYKQYRKQYKGKDTPPAVNESTQNTSDTLYTKNNNIL
ncbi:hypothetical protein [Flammeovirga pacifica]|uniref:Uncharacterized protein n=1 Tax=Flammeovirga pacifica TaxID=915059 RepID=A0A1S1YUP4_FLAPC|nr:hypothetical protein [Flammeovirga pacifica]OHX64740.1 hypothetical protein NH26_24570 [Flammeovirga pacifica]